MTVRYVINIWGCYGSNFEAASKKKVVLVILLLFWSPQNPFMAAEVLVGALQGFPKVSNLPSYSMHSSERYSLCLKMILNF